jgi:hypothetical protein
VREAQWLYDNKAPLYNLFQSLRTRVGEFYQKMYLWVAELNWFHSIW